MVYLGGKAKIAKHIVPVLQDIIDKNNILLYWEPMCGGCNIISKIKCPIKIGTDISEPLIALWIELQKGWQLPNEITEEHYNYVRTHHNEFPLHYLGLVGYLSSFGAKWFGGYARYKGKSGYPWMLQTVKRQIERGDIKSIHFGCCDYKEILYIIDIALYTEDDTLLLQEENYRDKTALIYVDPPYCGTSRYSGIPELDYAFFYEWCRWMSQRNFIIISEYDMPEDFECIKVIRHITNFSYKKNIKEEKLFKVKGGI